MGIVTGVQPDPDGEHLWIIERCSANKCAGSDHHPIHKLDMQGKTVKNYWRWFFRLATWFDMDEEGNFWITEGAPEGDARGAPGAEGAWATKWLKSIKRVRF
ncbi:MAG: hypothetical protein Ct9H90mP25_3510 [Gammaproteobacteria bacterium]|nr:MAG: hypothetical protein Ct9H90mP25_3510 [Gammaproteobacteria bacterium]